MFLWGSLPGPIFLPGDLCPGGGSLSIEGLCERGVSVKGRLCDPCENRGLCERGQGPIRNTMALLFYGQLVTGNVRPQKRCDRPIG